MTRFPDLQGLSDADRTTQLDNTMAQLKQAIIQFRADSGLLMIMNFLN